MHYFSRSEASAWLRRVARVNRDRARRGWWAVERAIKDKALEKSDREIAARILSEDTFETPTFYSNRDDYY